MLDRPHNAYGRIVCILKAYENLKEVLILTEH